MSDSTDQAFLNEVSNWKLEAKLEDVGRYFFDTNEFQQVKSGNKSFLIGRKGTGKTAIAQSIVRLHEHNVFTEELSFKNFPFDELYKLGDDRFSRPNQYITLWKFVIFNYIVKMLARNAAIAPEGQRIARAFHPPSLDARLERALPRWVISEVDLKVLGTGGAGKRTYLQPQATLHERVELLEDIIKEFLDQSIYYIVFDELDEDYRDILQKYNNNEYLDLMTGLFKAVQHTKQLFAGSNIRPIVVLRDDIYGILKDNDKNKWTDSKLDIEWKSDKIKRMLAHRISRLADSESAALPFDEAWKLIIQPRPVPYGFRQKRRMHAFDYMARSSHMRPRDFIFYIKVCAEKELSEYSEKIRPDTIRAQDKPFSNYLRDELRDEIGAVIPYIDSVFSTLSQIRKQTFLISDFIDVYDRKIPADQENRLDATDVLRILFHFSVIGNKGNGRSPLQFFRYENKDAELNFDEVVCVHRGLYKALQIL
ncbi:P-loop ATPase, Sll1717 family [Hyphomonas oceanitis]|uniref:P-loop ATPase, Sll1717 family n=1 Tax=Hyphomonas oceanitis TaxID=81033 RepID=UPI00300123BE